MNIGVPKEVKPDEYRVALLPVGAEELVRRGCRVLVQRTAGEGSGLTDSMYEEVGATLVDSAADVWADADLIVKVKEPQPEEWPMIRAGQVVFTYFHFAASRELTDAMLASRAACVAYETLSDESGRLPLLTPMSEVAGRMSVQEGAKYLEKPQMGRGILLGGVPGVAPAHITVIGGGVVGANAAKIAAGFQANVAILDVNMDRLRYLDDIMPANVDVLFSDRHTIRRQLERADLVIGAVLIPGAKAPLPGGARRPRSRMAPGQRAHRRGDRPRGLHRNQPPDFARGPDLRDRRRVALLCDQHAGRGGSHQHVRALQRDVAVGCSGWSKPGRSRPRPPRRRRSGAP